VGRELSRGTLWKIDIDRVRQAARIHLPAVPRLALCSVRLACGARHRCRFLVQGTEGMKQGGHGVAIRQLYRGQEVGRVSWQFHRRTKEEGRPC
jgi:serine protease